MPGDPRGLPRQRRGTVPQGRGRYPDYDVLANARHWDPVTRDAILRRVEDVPPLRFFDAREAATLGAFLDVVLAQDAEPRVPVLEMVDAKLHDRRLDGFRYADMPEDPETWRLVAAGLDFSAGGAFAECGVQERHRVVSRFADGELDGGPWERLNVSRAWSVVMRAALGAFYSHPWVWNEIGFGGPAYPRGYLHLGAGPQSTDPSEAPEAFAVDPVEDVPARGLE